MRPVTPSSTRLASYRLLPSLRAVVQPLAGAILTVPLMLNTLDGSLS